MTDTLTDAFDEDLEPRQCSECGGMGRVKPYGSPVWSEECNKCQGTGEVYD